MVYLVCLRCEESTEHYITHLSMTISGTGDVQVRCTECLQYRDGYVVWEQKTHKEVIKGDDD